MFWFTSFGQVKLSFPLGHFAVGRPSSPLIHELWRGAVAFAMRFNLLPLGGVCDGASENRKFQRELLTSSDNAAGFKCYYIDPDTGCRLYMMTCQSHWLKKLRNQLWRSGKSKPSPPLTAFANRHHRHQTLRARESPGTDTRFHKRTLRRPHRRPSGDIVWHELEWKTLLMLVEEDHGEGLAVSYGALDRITPDHLYLRASSMMRVYLARDILSKDVADVLDAKGQALNVDNFESLSGFVRHADRIWRHIGR